MRNVLNVALAGYDPFTDTNPDHFALYIDEQTDHVLIKELTRGSETLAAGDTLSIPHNLGYIPFFLVFVNDPVNSPTEWRILGNLNIFANYFAGVNTTELLLANNTGGSLTFKYFIFYDEFVSGTLPDFTESESVFKVAKLGKSADSRNPNDFIFHSDLNTFKIVHQDTHDLPIVIGTPTYSFAHNSPITNTSCMLVFGKFPDGKVSLLGSRGANSYDRNRSLNAVSFDATNIYIDYGLVASNYTLHLSWLIFEPPL